MKLVPELTTFTVPSGFAEYSALEHFSRVSGMKK